MTRFFFPDPEALKSSGHAGLASIPVLFDAGYRILEAENLYLCDRILGAWPIRKRDPSRPRDGGMAPNTVVALARRLHHFADWRLGRDEGERRELDDLTYDDVVTYEREQWLSQGAFHGRRISPQTASLRADVATDFLLWAASRGVRKTSFVAKPSSKAPTPWVGGSKRRVFTSRPLRGIPSRPEIDAWLAALGKQRGIPKQLICRVMVETGMRLMEAVALEVGQWPTMDDVLKARRAGRTRMDLLLTVTKNSKARTVKVPIQTASTVAHWVGSHDEGGRAWLAGVHSARKPKAVAPTRLFLSDRKRSEGVPIQRHTVFDCFREVEPRPTGWHPHMARHAFACHFMMRALQIDHGHSGMGVERWIETGGLRAAEELRLLLGHESQDTTRIYLNYLRLNVNIATAAGNFQGFLDGDQG